MTALNQLGNRLKNQPVIVAVKVFVDDHIADAVPGRIVQQQAAQHRLFGLQRMRRHAQLLVFGVGGWGIGDVISHAGRHPERTGARQKGILAGLGGGMSVLARGKAKLGGVEEGMAACGVCAMRGFDLPLGQPSGEIITRVRASA